MSVARSGIHRKVARSQVGFESVVDAFGEAHAGVRDLGLQEALRQSARDQLRGRGVGPRGGIR